MSEDHAAHINKHIRNYLVVFAALALLTIVTVWIAYFDLSPVKAVLLALFVATIKGSLVACVFMHLISEKKLIFIVLTIAVLFFIPLLLLPVATSLDAIGN
jgi:cytochrome c oxidase subunit 4